MNEIDWKRKLASRKLWVAIAGFVGGILLIFKVDAKLVETICGSIISLGSVVAYIVGEGYVDAAGAKQNVAFIAPIEPEAEEDEQEHVD